MLGEPYGAQFSVGDKPIQCLAIWQAVPTKMRHVAEPRRMRKVLITTTSFNPLGCEKGKVVSTPQNPLIKGSRNARGNKQICFNQRARCRNKHLLKSTVLFERLLASTTWPSR